MLFDDIKKSGSKNARQRPPFFDPSGYPDVSQQSNIKQNAENTMPLDTVISLLNAKRNSALKVKQTAFTVTCQPNSVPQLFIRQNPLRMTIMIVVPDPLSQIIYFSFGYPNSIKGTYGIRLALFGLMVGNRDTGVLVEPNGAVSMDDIYLTATLGQPQAILGYEGTLIYNKAA